MNEWRYEMCICHSEIENTHAIKNMHTCCFCAYLMSDGDCYVVCVVVLLDAVVNNYVAIIMLHIGCDEKTLYFPLTSSRRPSSSHMPPDDTRRDNDDFSVTTDSAVDLSTPLDNFTDASLLPSVSDMPADSSTYQPPLDVQPGRPAEQIPNLDNMYIVGPLIYVRFSFANTSDASFSVDLLFQHPSYAEASLPFAFYDTKT